MPRFDKSSVKEDLDSNKEIDNNDLDFEYDDEENEDGEYRPPSKPPVSVKREPVKKESNSKTIIIICVSIAIAVCIVIGYFIHKSNVSEEQRQSTIEAQERSIKSQADSVSDEDKQVKAGAPNLYGDSKDTNTSTVVSDTKITTNLNGEKVDPNYKIREIKTVQDFINYTKYRAITDKGMEFYWLETMYKDKKYKVQVPFAIYKELEKKGITVVDVEVTVLEDGSEVVTYMNVRKDAKTLLEKDEDK